MKLKQAKLIFLSALFTTSIILNIILAQTVLDIKRDQYTPPFPLSDNNATYSIKNLDSGEVVVEYKRDNLIKTAFLGSSLIPVESFIDQSVKINGNFRPIMGQPTCHKHCTGKYLGPVIDIQNVYVVE